MGTKAIIMYKTAIFVLASLLVAVAGSAQTIKILNSTVRNWSGGVAGKRGSNYSFVIEFRDFRKEPLPDTIWINQQPIPLSISTETVQGNTKRTRTKNAVKFEINAGTSRDDYADMYPDPEGKQRKAIPRMPRPCKGVALLSYLYRGKDRYYEIGAFTTTLEPVNYP